MKVICTLLIAATVALVAAGAASSTVAPKLLGTVGPGFTISLKQNGKLVRTVKAGRYTFVVSDKGSIHDFHLRGPGLSRVITGVGFTGTKTLTLALKRGTYNYRCDVHPTTMHGSFKVV
jgi:plastocyanin